MTFYGWWFDDLIAKLFIMKQNSSIIRFLFVLICSQRLNETDWQFMTPTIFYQLTWRNLYRLIYCYLYLFRILSFYLTKRLKNRMRKVKKKPFHPFKNHLVEKITRIWLVFNHAIISITMLSKRYNILTRLIFSTWLLPRNHIICSFN